MAAHAPKPSGYIATLPVFIRKCWYNVLWFIYYESGGVWGGPFKTKREAKERLEREAA